MTLNWDNPLAAPISRVQSRPEQDRNKSVTLIMDETVDQGEAVEQVEKNNTELSLEYPASDTQFVQSLTFGDSANDSDSGSQRRATHPTQETTSLAQTPPATLKASSSARRREPGESKPFTPMKPINSEDKRVINGLGDINQLAPFKYPWAWEFFINANKNHWTPLDINMAQDVHDYHHKLKPEERHVYENVLAYLTTSDILAMRNIGLAVMEKMTAPELQIYQARQVYEEALHCFKEGTEVLTPRGWVDFRTLIESETVAQYCEDGTIEFVKPLGITRDYFEGDLIRFSSSVYESVVTPNHRCVALDTRNDNKLVIQTAEQISVHNKNIPVAGRLNASSTASLSWLERLAIAYQADGTLLNSQSNDFTGTGYRFHFKREDKIERLETILNHLDLQYSKYTCADTSTRFDIPKQNLELVKDFSWVNFEAISYAWIREFIDELMNWDGSRSSDMLRYVTTNQRCYDVVMALGVMADYRCGVHKAETSAGNPAWTINFVDRPYVSGRTIEKTTETYSGYVYSVGVPSTMLVVRYNDKVTVSGNTWTYQHCIETIGLDQSEIYNRYRVVPEINQKIQIANRRLNAVMRSDIDLRHPDDLQEFVLSYAFFSGIFEGCWFYNGFSPIFALQRRGLMKGTAEQLQYIMRDEVMHCSFGIRVVRQIMQEENVQLDPRDIRDMWDEAEAAEVAYSQFLLPTPILGYSQQDHHEQFRFIANRRARSLGMEEPFPGAKNALPWLDEQSNMRKEKNFFETRVTEYQTGGALKWE